MTGGGVVMVATSVAVSRGRTGQSSSHRAPSPTYRPDARFPSVGRRLCVGAYPRCELGRTAALLGVVPSPHCHYCSANPLNSPKRVPDTDTGRQVRGRCNVLHLQTRASDANRRSNYHHSLGIALEPQGRPLFAPHLPAGGHPTAAGGSANVRHWVRHINPRCIRAPVSTSASTYLE